MSYHVYDWARMGPRIVADYTKGHLSNNALMLKYKVKPGALWAFLKKEGVIRTHKEARAVSREHGRLKAPKQRPRDCVACHQTFQPSTPRHCVCQKCAPTPCWRRRFDKYGVSKVTWDRILVKQRGHCALCPRAPTHVDHHHKTMTVRGLLCATCNQAMRPIDDDGRWGVRAARYAQRDTEVRANPSRHKSWARLRGRTL